MCSGRSVVGDCFSGPSPPVLGGEGWGEGPNVQWRLNAAGFSVSRPHLTSRPSTPTLSPEYRERGGQRRGPVTHGVLKRRLLAIEDRIPRRGRRNWMRSSTCGRDGIERLLGFEHLIDAGGRFGDIPRSRIHPRNPSTGVRCVGVSPAPLRSRESVSFTTCSGSPATYSTQNPCAFWERAAKLLRIGRRAVGGWAGLGGRDQVDGCRAREFLTPDGLGACNGRWCGGGAPGPPAWSGNPCSRSRCTWHDPRPSRARSVR